MPLFGKPRKKQSAFEIRLTPTPRDKAAEVAAAAGDKAIRILAREKKKEEARQALVDRAEEIKAAAEKRRLDAEAKKKREKDRQARANRGREPEHKTACTCRTPTVRNGKCTRCRKPPTAPRRRWR